MRPPASRWNRLRAALIRHRRRLFRLLLLALALWLFLPGLLLLDDGPALSTLAKVAPHLAGLSGPMTYLLLIQNEDELRATGGFITAVGTVTIDRGRVRDMDIEDSFAVDDRSFQYPLPPEPLRVYMDAPVWLLRDSNWSPDFPTAAAFADALYTATHPGAIDGVISVDQTALLLMLEGAGPVHVAGLPQAVTSQNVLELMRSAREPAPGEGVNYEWWLHRKDFVPDIARALLKRVLWSSWPRLADSAIRALNERHVQIWLKDPADAVLLAERGWDGALQPGSGDYLLVVDANVGFNKVNAIIQAQIGYSVDLADLAAPTGHLSVAYTNPAAGQAPCQPGPDYGSGTYTELIDRCYWNYLRVYVPRSATLLGGSPHDYPAEWMLTGRPESGTITVWPGEHNLQSFGTLVIVPFSSTVTTDFDYSLPPGAITREGDNATYTLHLQKQAGTQAVPVHLRVTLPAGARVVSASVGGRLSGSVWELDLALARDVELQLVFSPP